MGYIEEMRQLIGSRPLITVGAAILMIDAHDRILLQLRTDNRLWGIPGGGLEPGETLEETARREVYEETGLRAGTVTLFGTFSGPELDYTYPNGDRVVIVSTVFTCAEWTGELLAQPDESVDLKFFALNELPAQLSPPNIPVIREFLRNSLARGNP